MEKKEKKKAVEKAEGKAAVETEELKPQEIIKEIEKTFTVPSEEDLESLILDTDMNKYDVIILARRWAYELQSREGGPRSVQDVIACALDDILSGKVKPETVMKLPPLRSIKKPKGPLDFLSKQGPETGEKSSVSNGKKDGK